LRKRNRRLKTPNKKEGQKKQRERERGNARIGKTWKCKDEENREKKERQH